MMVFPPRLVRVGGARLPPFHYLPIPHRSRVRRSFSFSFETGENVSRISLRIEKDLREFIKLNLSVFVRDGGKCDSFAFRFEPKKDLSEFIKLNLSVFVRNGGKCERFAFRFVPKKNVSETGATYFDLPP